MNLILVCGIALAVGWGARRAWLLTDELIGIIETVAAAVRNLAQASEGVRMTLTELKDQVTALQTVDAAAIALLDGLHQQLTDAIATNDPAAIQAIADQLAAEKASLADAVTRNTPAAPPV